MFVAPGLKGLRRSPSQPFYFVCVKASFAIAGPDPKVPQTLNQNLWEPTRLHSLCCGLGWDIEALDGGTDRLAQYAHLAVGA